MKKIEWIGCCLLALFVGCSQESEEFPAANDTKLQLISVDVSDKTESRAEATSVAKIKLYAVNGATNAPFIANNTGDVYEYKEGQWQVATTLPLTTTSVTVYACWPESLGLTTTSDADIATVPVTILDQDKLAAGSQVDYLYATAIPDVKSTNKAISLTMQHSLSKISFRIEKALAAESDDITLKKLEIVSGTSRLQSGTGKMNLKGVLSGLTDRNIIALNGNLLLTYPQALPNITCLVAPMAAEESVLSFKLTVDAAGKERVFETQVVTPAQFWKAGNHYVYHIVVNKLGASFSGIKINKWGSDANQDTSIGI